MCESFDNQNHSPIDKTSRVDARAWDQNIIGLISQSRDDALAEDVESAKEIECSRYESTFAIFSSGLTFARFIFFKTNLMIPGHVLHS